MTGYTFDVSIDGTDVAVLTLEYAKIEYGRESVWDQPALPVAVLELVTADADQTIADVWPEFALGGGVGRSGFVDTYGDVYAGPSTRVLINTPVVVAANTDSGFVDTYGDVYAGAYLPRFTGAIEAIDYTPEAVVLTCLPEVESWSRLKVGGTDDTTPIPEETDVERVQRFADEARVVIDIDGDPGPVVTAIPINTKASPLIEELEQLAIDCRALFFIDRLGVAHYWTQNHPTLLATVDDATEIPSDATLDEPLKMSLERSTVRTRVTIEYGDVDGDTNLRPTVTAEDPARAVDYGWREYDATVQLVDPEDAAAFATATLTALAPAWSLPDAVVQIDSLTDAQITAIAGLEQGSWVSIPSLRVEAPVEDYASPILGYSEVLARDDWQITYHLAPLTMPITTRS